MLAEEDGWLTASLSDDSVAAELLLQLRRSRPHPPAKPDSPSLRLDWSVRQRRTTGPPQQSKEPAEPKEDDGEQARASPSTPLSWSSASSTSCGAEGSEDSSRLNKPLAKPRSKVSATTPNPCTKTNNNTKRSRRKKTLAELQEEEASLLKERRSLRHELEKLLNTVEKQRAVNESLKKIKLDLQEQLPPTAHRTEATSPGTVTSTRHCSPPPDVTEVNEDEHCSQVFALPDLNLPAEESDFGVC